MLKFAYRRTILRVSCCSKVEPNAKYLSLPDQMRFILRSFAMRDEGTHGTQVKFVLYVSGLRSIPGGSRQNRINVLVTRTRFETETGSIDSQIPRKHENSTTPFSNPLRASRCADLCTFAVEYPTSSFVRRAIKLSILRRIIRQGTSETHELLPRKNNEIFPIDSPDSKTFKSEDIAEDTMLKY